MVNPSSPSSPTFPSLLLSSNTKLTLLLPIPFQSPAFESNTETPLLASMFAVSSSETSLEGSRREIEFEEW